MAKTICIIGGSQKQTLEKIGKKNGVKVLFHDGKQHKKCFNSLIKKSDAVVVMEGACGHISMWKAKDTALKYDKPIKFHAGFGASGAIEKGMQLIY